MNSTSAVPTRRCRARPKQWFGSSVVVPNDALGNDGNSQKNTPGGTQDKGAEGLFFFWTISPGESHIVGRFVLLDAFVFWAGGSQGTLRLFDAYRTPGTKRYVVGTSSSCSGILPTT